MRQILQFSKQQSKNSFKTVYTISDFNKEKLINVVTLNNVPKLKVNNSEI